MKKLSKRATEFIKLFLSMRDMKYVSLKKHDVRILYDIYEKSIKQYISYEDEIDMLSKDNNKKEKLILKYEDIINAVKQDLVNTKKLNNHFKDKHNNELINVDIDHIDYLIKIMETKENER